MGAFIVRPSGEAIVKHLFSPLPGRRADPAAARLHNRNNAANLTAIADRRLGAHVRRRMRLKDAGGR
jgi:hypothetical protein